MVPKVKDSTGFQCQGLYWSLVSGTVLVPTLPLVSGTVLDYELEADYVSSDAELGCGQEQKLDYGLEQDFDILDYFDKDYLFEQKLD